MSLDIKQEEEPPVLIPIESRPRRSVFRLRHLLYGVLYAALCTWLGAMSGLLLFSGLLTLMFAFVIGALVIYGRRRSTQRESLIWALAMAAERAMPLGPTLDAIAGQCRGGYRRKVKAAASFARQGLSMSQIMTQEPGLSPRDSGVLIRVGDDSGMLAGALREASSTRTATRGPWLVLATRIIYLLWVLIILQTIVGFLAYFIMPKMEAIFADFGVPFPAITSLAFETTHVIGAWFPLVLMVVFMQMGFLVLLSLSIFGTLPWDLPLIDRLFLRRHSALVLRCLARMVEANTPMGEGLSTLARIYPSAWVARRLRDAARDVDRGDDWRVALARRNLVGHSDAVLLESAQRVGNLPWALREAAGNAERRLAYRLQAMVVWVLPLLVLAMGAIVFVVAVAYFLPVVTLIQRLA